MESSNCTSSPTDGSFAKNRTILDGIGVPVSDAQMRCFFQHPWQSGNPMHSDLALGTLSSQGSV